MVLCSGTPYTYSKGESACALMNKRSKLYRLQSEADITVDSASVRAANALGAALGIVTQCRAARPLMHRQHPVVVLPTDVMKVGIAFSVTFRE